MLDTTYSQNGGLPVAVQKRSRRPLPLHPELAQRRADWSATSKRKAWKRMRAEPRFHCSYAIVSGDVAGSACWHWIGVRSDEGYGRFMAEGWKGQAHRYAMEHIAGWGPIDQRRLYRHCGDPACVNPDHHTCDDTPLAWDDPVTAPHIGRNDIPRPAASRFWANVDRECGFCWRWTGTVGSQGYGQFTIRRGWAIGAHRMAYALAYGTVPTGLHVCHGPGCEDSTGAGRLRVNPAHLRADTAESNSHDMNGGHFRRDLADISMTEAERELTKEFMMNLGLSPEANPAPK